MASIQKVMASLKGGVELKKTQAVNDRSAAQVSLAGPDEVAEEAERWRYFFASGCSSWFEDIKAHTFPSTFCTLTPAEAKLIVDHWEARGRALIVEEEGGGKEAEGGGEKGAVTKVDELLEGCLKALQELEQRLDVAVASECAKSSVGRCFVKLSTRSPKDSKKVLRKAALAFHKRVEDANSVAASADPAVAGAESAPLPSSSLVSANDKWVMLSEEVTKASSVSSGRKALELLLDSDRVFEDLEYALRGPPVDNDVKGDGSSIKSSSSADAGAPAPAVSLSGEKKAAGAAGRAASDERAKLCWEMSLVARAWDPRVTPMSEFRGIVWSNQLTCLCQYFHPLFFSQLQNPEVAAAVERDCIASFNQPAVKAAVSKLGGHCIIDFCWVGEGEPVIVVELNPFDGVCLGTFPASTGLFLWENPVDRAVMSGESPFEFRIRTEPLASAELNNSCNKDWRDIITPPKSHGKVSSARR